MAFAPSISLSWLDEFNACIAKHSGVATRALSEAEIVSLKANGNRVSGKSWDGVRVRLEAGRTFDSSAVQRCTFVGQVELGKLIVASP